MNKLNIETKDLFSTNDPLLKDVFDNAKYPWEILPLIKEIVKKGLEEGIEKSSIQIAMNLLESGMSPEEVAKYTELSIEVIHSLVNSN